MTNMSHSAHVRGAVVAAAGIIVGALCQASLIDSTQRLPASPANDATRPRLSTWKTERTSQACASLGNEAQRSRAVERECPIIEIAVARSTSNWESPSN
jgi:hypothetical protein